MGDEMVKYTRSIEVMILVGIIILFPLGVGLWLVINGRWNLTDSLILFSILVGPTLLLLPICQTVKIYNDRVCLNFWFIKLRTFFWTEVHEIGAAYARGGYGTYMKYVYISKRYVTDKERFDILHVKDRKNFITMENRGNMIEDIKKYSKLPFRDLPTKEDFNNM
ncbi:hypothetical protein CAFE_32730 [Caprobacter fermentans]|uniref:Uncharacterized protein n=1 Tax=Caproicibacter fermentans TaxID=2576756 RepID=A0A6N8I4V2_9FIRM|nr:hypothetical protein [Caproicibacter fermentans]MVB12533.1 hypothetical protein [Caproicibacter fermentans]